jgi:hypothetical protein
MKIDDWFSARIPEHWGATGVEVVDDPEEILVVLDLGRGELDAAAARSFREATRDERMALACTAEEAFGRKVSWGAKVGDRLVLFTTASVPVMTRLRLPERRVLDTLIDAGLVRTRSEALAWCVRLVAENESEWITDLRSAFRVVEEVRDRGPKSRRSTAGR